MKIFIDESGKFESHFNSNFGIMVIVTISDTAYSDFKEFLRLNLKNYREKKANELSFEEREILLKYIGRHPEIKYTAFVYDHKATSLDAISIHQKGQLKKLEEGIKKVKKEATNEAYINDLNLLYNQIQKLSVADYLKIISLIELIREWKLTITFDYIELNEKRDSWDFHFLFDMQNKAPTFLRIIYSMLVLTDSALNQNNEPMLLPKEWSDKHPFIIKYDTVEGINLKKFFLNRTCVDDKLEIGIKLPDLISNTIYRSITRQENIQWLKILKRLRPNRSFVHTKHGREGYYKIVSFRSSEGLTIPTPELIKHYDSMNNI